MAKKITIRLDDATAHALDELSRKTQIPKVRLTKQAYAILIACYKKLNSVYDQEIVDLNFMEFIKGANGDMNDESS